MMHKTFSRFDCPSASLSLRGLLRRARTALWVGLGLAVAMHFSLSQLGSFTEEKKTVKPLTTQFIKRKPRLTKPLEMKKRPRPKQRRIQRKMVSVEAQMGRKQRSTGIRLTQVMSSLARPKGTMDRFAQFQSITLEPQMMAQAIESTKETQHVVDMSLEMVDIEALDTGEYHAMVIQDPTDKRRIRGFFHMARAYPQSAASAEGQVEWSYGTAMALPGAISNLVRGLNRYTEIRTDLITGFTLDSRELLNTPIVFIASHVPFELGASEATNLGHYLMKGGFLYTDTLAHRCLSNYRSERQMWKDALATQGIRYGVDWEYEPLSPKHPIYHCYFDFDRAPDGFNAIHGTAKVTLPNPQTIEAIIIDGRLWGILNMKNYMVPLLDVYYPRPGAANRNYVRQLQFMINVVIFALTQEGSITNQVMDSVE